MGFLHVVFAEHVSAWHWWKLHSEWVTPAQPTWGGYQPTAGLRRERIIIPALCPGTSNARPPASQEQTSQHGGSNMSYIQVFIGLFIGPHNLLRFDHLPRSLSCFASLGRFRIWGWPSHAHTAGTGMNLSGAAPQAIHTPH